MKKAVYKVNGGCVLCQSCIYVCPRHAIRLNPNVSCEIDEELCVGCGKCADECQAEAIVRVEIEK